MKTSVSNNQNVQSMRAENRHYDKIHKKKKHPASKCGNAKWLVCHSDKVFNVPDRQRLRQLSKEKSENQ